MKFLSLFAGIGGFDLGLERAGMECVGQVENNEFCLKVLEKHWPHVKRIPDIRDVKGDEFGPVDLICGGYPCQPFSLAGQRRGAEDDRHLWPEMYRLVAEIRPSWVIGENVFGHIHMGLDEVLSDLETEGYTWRPFVVPACAVNAPHRRERVWILAHSVGNGRHDGGSRSQRHEGDAQPVTGSLCEPGVWASRSANVAYGDRQERGTGSMESDAGANGRDNARGCRESGRGALADAGHIPGRTEGASRGMEGADGLQQKYREKGASQLGNSGEFVANPELKQWDGWRNWTCGWEREPQEALQDARQGGGQEAWMSIPESLLGRVADGISSRVDRLKSLGNAVVPQIPEIIGRMILEIEKQ